MVNSTIWRFSWLLSSFLWSWCQIFDHSWQNLVKILKNLQHSHFLVCFQDSWRSPCQIFWINSTLPKFTHRSEFLAEPCTIFPQLQGHCQISMLFPQTQQNSVKISAILNISFVIFHRHLQTSISSASCQGGHFLISYSHHVQLLCLSAIKTTINLNTWFELPSFPPLSYFIQLVCSILTLYAFRLRQVRILSLSSRFLKVDIPFQVNSHVQ